jgi:DNA-binding transcriptional LysR family regulator
MDGLMPLNLRQIETFRAVITTGSISGAAKLLFVSQPAVSRSLAHMEQRLGFALFERVKGRLYATPEAKKLHREVEAVYRGVQRVSELALELSEKRAGILHLASSPSIGHLLMPRAIAAFSRAYPEVKVTFQSLTIRPLTDILLDGRADLGVAIFPAQHPNLQTLEVGSGCLICICPYNHPLASRAVLSIADLQPYPLISYNPDSPFGRVIYQHYQESGQDFRVAMEVSSPHNACSLVKAGAGIAIVDEFSARSAQGDFVLRPLDKATRLTINLVQSRFEPLSQLAQEFIKCFKSTISEMGFDSAASE